MHTKREKDDPDFITMIFGLILEKSVGLLLMGGDFNCVMSQLKDRQPVPSNPPLRMSKALNDCCTETGIVDAWRYKYPNGKDFTYYSNRHLS